MTETMTTTTPTPPPAVRKGNRQIGTIGLGQRKSYVFGRHPKMAQVVLDHGSISRRHAAIAHGCPPAAREDGRKKGHRQPPSAVVVVDLGSAHGTMHGAASVSSSSFSSTLSASSPPTTSKKDDDVTDDGMRRLTPHQPVGSAPEEESKYRSARTQYYQSSMRASHRIAPLLL